MIEFLQESKPNTIFVDLKNFIVPEGCPFRWEDLTLNLDTHEAYAGSKYIGQFEQCEDGIIIKMKDQ